MLDQPFSFMDLVGKEHSHMHYRVHMLASPDLDPCHYCLSITFQYYANGLIFWLCATDLRNLSLMHFPFIPGLVCCSYMVYCLSTSGTTRKISAQEICSYTKEDDSKTGL